jgi:hypothetical protein
MEHTPLDYTDSLAISLLWVAVLCLLAVVLGWLADRPRHPPRHSGPAGPDRMPPARSLARRVGEGCAARPVVGPGGAPGPGEDTVSLARPCVTVPIPDLDTERIPVLVVDSPPSMRGTLPTPDLGVPIVRIWSCGLCHDGAAVIGEFCIWCGLPHPAAVRS